MPTTITQVCQNIENTIVGKERYLQSITKGSTYDNSHTDVITQFIQINIKELKDILKDIKQVEQKFTN